MNLTDAVCDYLNALRHEQGASPTTFTTYQNRLRNLCKWLDANGYPDARLDVLTVPTLRRYLYHLSGKGDRPRTIRGCFNAIRGLCTFLVNAGALTENPAAKVTLPKLDAAARLTVTDAEVAALFQACERQRTQREVALSRAVFSAMCYGGLRRAEVYSLRVDDVNLTDKSLLVRSGKGSKSRRVFVCADAVNALREWLAVRPTNCNHDWLFAYDRNRRLHDEGIASLVETIKATAGLRDNAAIKPHSLRHWCATNLLRNGANIKDVQAFLGHSDIRTTAVYLHSDEHQLRALSELTALRPQTPPQPHKEATEPRTGQRDPRGERPRRIAR